MYALIRTENSKRRGTIASRHRTEAAAVAAYEQRRPMTTQQLKTKIHPIQPT